MVLNREVAKEKSFEKAKRNEFMKSTGNLLPLLGMAQCDGRTLLIKGKSRVKKVVNQNAIVTIAA